MRELSVYIELNGIQTLVGTISGEQYNDARFRYVREYIEAREAIISLLSRQEIFLRVCYRKVFLEKLWRIG